MVMRRLSSRQKNSTLLQPGEDVQGAGTIRDPLLFFEQRGLQGQRENSLMRSSTSQTYPAAGGTISTAAGTFLHGSSAIEKSHESLLHIKRCPGQVFPAVSFRTNVPQGRLFLSSITAKAFALLIKSSMLTIGGDNS